MTEQALNLICYLAFPALGVAMAVFGGLAHSRTQRARLETVQAYVAQGIEPPAELLKLVSR